MMPTFIKAAFFVAKRQHAVLPKVASASQPRQTSQKRAAAGRKNASVHRRPHPPSRGPMHRRQTAMSQDTTVPGRRLAQPNCQRCRNAVTRVSTGLQSVWAALFEQLSDDDKLSHGASLLQPEFGSSNVDRRSPLIFEFERLQQ